MILQDLFHNYLAGSYQRSCQDYLAMISPRSCQDLTKVLSKLMECHNRQTMQMLCLSFIFCPFASFAWRESFMHEHAILMPWYFCMNWSCLFALTLTSARIKITFLTIKRRSVYFINFSSFGWSYIIIWQYFYDKQRQWNTWEVPHMSTAECYCTLLSTLTCLHREITPMSDPSLPITKQFVP